MGGFPKNRSHIYHYIPPYHQSITPLNPSLLHLDTFLQIQSITPLNHQVNPGLFTLESRFITPLNPGLAPLKVFIPLESTSLLNLTKVLPFITLYQGHLGNGCLSPKPLSYLPPYIPPYIPPTHSPTTHYTLYFLVYEKKLKIYLNIYYYYYYGRFL